MLCETRRTWLRSTSMRARVLSYFSTQLVGVPDRYIARESRRLAPRPIWHNRLGLVHFLKSVAERDQRFYDEQDYSSRCSSSASISPERKSSPSSVIR